MYLDDVQRNQKGRYISETFGKKFMKTEYQHDELGRLVNTVKKYGENNVSEDKMTYDLDGNLTEETAVLNNIQTSKKSYVYDDLGRVVRKSDADVPFEYIEYNKNSDQIKSYTIETGKGMPHSKISAAQNARRDARVAIGKGKWSSTLQEELGYIVEDFTNAGFSKQTISEVLEQQYRMLDKLKVPYERIDLK